MCKAVYVPSDNTVAANDAVVGNICTGGCICAVMPVITNEEQIMLTAEAMTLAFFGSIGICLNRKTRKGNPFRVLAS